MRSLKGRLDAWNRSSRHFVFGPAVRNGFLAWLGLAFVSLVVGATTGPRALQVVAVGWAFPLLFTCTTWLIACSFALEAAAAFTRREVGICLWMLGWTAIMGIAGLGGVRWLLYGLGGEGRA